MTMTSSIRRISGTHDPQFVPALSLAPIASTVPAPSAAAASIVVDPTPKHAQTVGSAATSPSAARPDSSAARSTPVRSSFANKAPAACQSGAISPGPANRHA